MGTPVSMLANKYASVSYLLSARASFNIRKFRVINMLLLDSYGLAGLSNMLSGPDNAEKLDNA